MLEGIVATLFILLIIYMFGEKIGLWDKLARFIRWISEKR